MKHFYSFLVLLNCFNLQSSAQVGFNKVGYINTEDGTNSFTYYDVVIDKDNKILAVGTTDLGNALIARYTQHGILDTSFNNTGFTVFPTNQIDTGLYNSVIIDRNNKIIAVGRTSDTAVGLIVRFNENGTLDTTFNARSINGGLGYINQADNNNTNAWVYHDATIDKNNNIVVVGQTLFVSGQGNNRDGLIARYDQNGELDTTFNQTGYSKVEGNTDSLSYNAVAIDNNNNIIVVGRADDENGLIARYTQHGILDTSFNSTGYINGDQLTNSDVYYDVALDKNNKIVVVGATNARNQTNDGLIARYNSDGSLDTTFNGTGYINVDHPNNSESYQAVFIDSNNKIIAVGLTDPDNDDNNERNGLIVRYNENGTLDTTFNGTGYINGTDSINSWIYYSVFVDKNNKIVVVGRSDPLAMQTDGVIVRYLSNGQLDTESNWNSQNFREIAKINNTPIGMMSS
ncbi:MAG: hypothetical protein EBU90_24005 [Proteobacteria bacterium]|nr:hypothetical protein [Pseudomonadota bacterium]NBP16319.1 hypothetical protein [bacterium]